MPAQPAEQGRALIVGTNRGLGFGLAREMLNRDWSVIGTARSGADVSSLRNLQSEHPGRLSVEDLDLSDPDQIDSFAAKLAPEPLNLVVLSAASMGPAHESVKELTLDECRELFFVNSIGPVRLAHRLTNHLAADGGVFVFITSVLGSIERNQNGWTPLYRASKCALHSLSRSLYMSTERRFAVLLLHPGWVKTEMGGPDAALEIEDSATSVFDVILRNRFDRAHRYLDHQGDVIPW